MIFRVGRWLLELFENGQALIDTYRIACAVLSAVDKIIDKERIVLYHNAALEEIALLQGRVFALDSLEHTTANILHDAVAVWQPTYTDAVARSKLVALDGKTGRDNLRLAALRRLQRETEGLEMLTTNISAQHIERAGKDRLVATDTTPQTTQSVLGEVIVGSSFDIGRQQREVGSRFERVTKLLFYRIFQRNNLY